MVAEILPIAEMECEAHECKQPVEFYFEIWHGICASAVSKYMMCRAHTMDMIRHEIKRDTKRMREWGKNPDYLESLERWAKMTDDELLAEFRAPWNSLGD